ILCRDTTTRGSSYMGRLKLPSLSNPSANIKDYLPQRGTHRHLYETGILDVPCQGKDLSALAPLSPNIAIPLCTLLNDNGDVGQGFHVVYTGGLTPESRDSWIRGSYAGHTAFTLYGGNEGRFLPAYKGPCPFLYLKVKV